MINLTAMHNQRFFSYLSLFTFMMILLVTADNYLIMFVGWEGILIFQVISLLLLIFLIYKLIYNKNRLYNPIIKYNYNTTSNINKLNLKKFNNKRYYSTNKLSKKYKEECELTPEQKETLIGVILGDGYLEKLNERSNTRLKIDNAYPDQEEFVNKLRELFDPITNMKPKVLIRNDKRSNKTTQSIYFWTLTLPCLNYYHNLFYKDKIKLIPNNIGELLTEKGLAFWIMGDGMYRKDRGGVVICTDSFTLQDTELLVNVLVNKYGLSASIQTHRENVYRIYIHKKSLDKLRDLIKPYFVSCMKYKIGL